MSNYLSVKAVAIALFALAATCTCTARAGEIVSSNDVFSSGTSFETHPEGAFDPYLSEKFFESDPDRNFWYSTTNINLGEVSAYYGTTGVLPYDYDAKGLARKDCFTNGNESTVKNYLSLAAEQNLDRGIFGLDIQSGDFSNVLVRTKSRDSIYCDMLTQFTPNEETPAFDPSVRIALWVRITQAEDGSETTNLIASAGYFTNRLSAVEYRDYRLDLSAVCPDGIDFTKWYRLTIRAHGDVSLTGVGLAGFSIYIDGKGIPALAEDYEICDASSQRISWLIPEARALYASRRLFPSRAAPGSDAAFQISRLTFLGVGALDDVSFSSEHPGYAWADTVFTLNWDAGFAKLGYSLDGGLTTNALDVTAARTADIPLGTAATNGFVLKVYAEYDSTHGFHPGVWAGSNGATLTNGTEFAFDGSTRNPIGAVASSRESVYVGTNKVEGATCYDTFASALAVLDKSTNEVKTLTLNSDVTVSAVKDAYGNNDMGCVRFTNPAGRYVLDLMGHTLQGSIGKTGPTISINAGELRIIDSSEADPVTKTKSGRVLPVASYTNANDSLNASVQVYPRVGVAGPVLTIEDGIYDGWVRNKANDDRVTPVTGTVVVAGGSYISTNSETFYLDSCVTNPSLLYVYRSGYWISRGDTNLVIWTGLGDGTHWTDPANWRNQRLPQPTETALFPSRSSEEGPWTVDVGSNAMTTAKLWLEGDVYLSGTNDFLGVTLESEGLGRICGDATLVYEGDQPGSLTATTLRDDWAGTVLVRNIGYSSSKTKIPKVLKNMETWGTTNSTVVFNGVRGYVMDVKSHTMPYDFVLRDLVVGSVTNAAWQNDSGYTGSTLSFLGALLGDGTFQSAKNARAILQLYKFADVQDFSGKFAVNGKRVLLGSETVMASVAGLIAFGNKTVVRTGLGWTCQNALFDESLYLLGQTNDVLVTAKNEPDVTCCTNVTLNWKSGIAWLASTNDPAYAVYVTDKRPAWLDPSEPIALLAPLATMAPVLTASPSLTSAASDDAYSAATLAALRRAALAQAAVAVESADLSLEFDGDDVIVTVRNAAPGLWYGIRHRATLAAEWDPMDEQDWVQPTGSTVTLSYSRSDSGFFGVVVACEDPLEAEEEGSDD